MYRYGNNLLFFSNFNDINIFMSFLFVSICPIGIPKLEVSGNILNCVCEAFLTDMCSLYVFLILHHFPYKT